jgi:hypothetical protein
LKSGSKKNANWAQLHRRHVNEATHYADHVYEVGRPWDINDLLRYRKWYQENCMASVYLFGQHVVGMDRNVPVPRDEHSKSGYIPSGSTFVRTVNISNSEFYDWFIIYHLLYSEYTYRLCVG